MLKTIVGLQGVKTLSKEAQKRFKGGATTCGVLFQAFGGGPVYVIYVTDENGNGKTRDEAIAWAGGSTGIAPAGSLENTGRWCCDSCAGFPTAP
jgi:hypothetical protein